MAGTSTPATQPVIVLDDAGSSLNLPDTRDTYRVRIPVTLRLPPVRLSNEEVGIKGTLVDISRVGAAVLASPETALKKGSQVRCEIELPNTHLHVDAEVRSCVALKHHLRLGLRFIGLSKIQRQQIENTTATLERTVLRNLHPMQKPVLRA